LEDTEVTEDQDEKVTEGHDENITGRQDKNVTGGQDNATTEGHDTDPKVTEKHEPIINGEGGEASAMGKPENGSKSKLKNMNSLLDPVTLSWEETKYVIIQCVKFKQNYLCQYQNE